ncbi:MAG TPA: hypothetical protein VM074_11665 [Solimonas sp.]|nr:hypothetical protein [Solimonas sp.]
MLDTSGMALPPKRDEEDDDPWRAVTRGTLESLNRPRPRRAPASTHGLGDTAGMLLRPGAAGEVAEAPNEGSSEIADLLTRTLAEEPGRLDLWLMRFEIFRSQGMKQEFIQRAAEAAASPQISRKLDWTAVRRMWEALAPGESLPDAPEAVPAKPGPAEPAGPGQRRFSDLAGQLAKEPLAALAQAYGQLRSAPGFYRDFSRATMRALRRPTALTPCTLFAGAAAAGSAVFLKREDQRSVPPEFENAVAQAWIGSSLGRTALVSGNDIDTHSIALASVAATQSLPCTIFLAPDEFDQKESLVAQLLRSGVSLEAAEPGTDPRLAALKYWEKAADRVHLALSLGTGPAPYPVMVSDFQSLLGRETDAQYRALGRAGAARVCVASMHSRADAIGFILPYLPHAAFRLVIVEPEDQAAAGPAHAASRAWRGRTREHRWLRATGRVQYVTLGDAPARALQARLAQGEEIEIGLEDARALAWAGTLAESAGSAADICVLVA